jgi:hypothetical protein
VNGDLHRYDSLSQKDGSTKPSLDPWRDRTDSKIYTNIDGRQIVVHFPTQGTLFVSGLKKMIDSNAFGHFSGHFFQPIIARLFVCAKGSPARAEITGGSAAL